MQDRPSLAELLDAVRGFLDKDAIEGLEGTAKFHARVAANVLAIATRELELEPAHLAAEWQRLDALLGHMAVPPDMSALRDGIRARTEALCERIRSGDADDGPFRAAVFEHVRTTVREKLAVTNPKLLAVEDAAP
jgi:hypothetical protein